MANYVISPLVKEEEMGKVLEYIYWYLMGDKRHPDSLQYVYGVNIVGNEVIVCVQEKNKGWHSQLGKDVQNTLFPKRTSDIKLLNFDLLSNRIAECSPEVCEVDCFC